MGRVYFDGNLSGSRFNFDSGVDSTLFFCQCEGLSFVVWFVFVRF